MMAKHLDQSLRSLWRRTRDSTMVATLLSPLRGGGARNYLSPVVDTE
jgi:hypothetical protein